MLVSGDPVGVELIIPDCCEAIEIIPQKTYFGGEEGDGKYVWYRSKERLHESTFLDLSTSDDDVLICGNTL